MLIHGAAEDTDIPEAETDAAEKGDTPDTDSEMDSGEVETDNTDIDGSDELPDDFDVDAEMDVDIEVDVENVPNEVLETDNIPDSQEFENMLNSDVQDMAAYAVQYDGSREDIGDLEDYGDAEVDMDADFGDVDVVEDPIEPEANFEADIAFIRKQSEVDTPLCTIEIRQDTIVQARGMSNRPAENIPKMKGFINAWAKNKGLIYAA